MAYAKPQVLVFQEFTLIPTAITDPLRAYIVGPHGKLHRYAEEDERELVELGEYDSTVTTAYDWPDKAAGSRIDPDYTKLYVKGGLLRYFRDLVGIGSTVTPVSGYANRIRGTDIIFKEGNDFLRSNGLYNRDVQLGDRVKVWGIGSDADIHTLNTYVRGFAGEVTDSSVDTTPSAASSNATDQAYVASIDKIGGADNTIQIDADGTGYDGLPSGNIDEFYTIEVTTGSTAGDLTTARLRVTSASGTDNESDVAPSAHDNFFAVGARGLLIKFFQTESTSNSSAAEFDEVSPDDLVAGQKWRVHVQQAYTAPTPTAAGTYTGLEDTTYIITVTRGGGYAVATPPQITVTTTTGYDTRGPVSVPDSGESVAVGNHGVTVQWNGGSGLRKGDIWYIEVAAEGEGAFKTLVLGHDLPDELESATDLNLELYIKKDYEVTENRVGFAPDVNWEQSQTEFTVNEGIVGYDSTWIDDDDLEMAMDLVGGTLFVEYREWINTHIGVTASADGDDDLEDLLGTIHPDNPLGYAVSKALANSGGTTVMFTAVEDPEDTEAWTETLDLALGRDDIYNLVPLTHDRAIQDLFAAHVEAQSSPEAGLWRACFLNLPYPTTKELVSADTSDDEEAVLARLIDDPNTSGTQYTLLQITSGNAGFDDPDVRAGDKVRFLFSTDGFGNESYTEFEIDEVLSDTSVRLVEGHSAEIAVPQRVEIWRDLKKAEIAEELAQKVASFGNRRVCVVAPDEVGSAGETVPGYHLCAALAGLRSGVSPHQPLTNVEISGFDDLSRVKDFFSNTHLDTMAESGVWIVTQDRNGTVVTRHALTTDVDSINDKEEVVRANVDSISYVFLNRLRPLIGRANVAPTTLDVISTTIRSVIEYLKSNGFTPTLGSQLIDGELVQLRQHALFRDRVTAVVNLTLPYPLNHIELYLVV